MVGAMNPRTCVLLVLATALPGCGSSTNAPDVPSDAGPTEGGAIDSPAAREGAADAAAPLPTGKFHIGMWCGPPASELTKQRFDQVAAAGITTVSPPCESGSDSPS